MSPKRLGLAAFTFLALVSAGLAQQPAPPAAEPPDTKAQKGVGGYLAIMAMTEVCDFKLDGSIKQAIMANVDALIPTSRMTSADLENGYKMIADNFKKQSALYCGMNPPTFEASVVSMAMRARAEAEGSGVALKAIGSAQLSSSAPDRITGSDADAIVKIVLGFGEAKLDKDRSGDPIIRARSNGSSWNMLFHGCEKGTACKSVELHYGIAVDQKPAADRINTWNRTTRWSKAYLDKDNDPNISVDISLLDGVEEAYLKAELKRWVDNIGGFKNAIAVGK
jgi:hypothetical protein